MSPIALHEDLTIERVAIIGAGPCGLAGAKYLAAEKKFTKIEIFEQRADPGGVWNYTALNVIDDEFTIPRTKPTTSPDTAISTGGDEAAQFVSPVYDQLETNIPHTLMNYSDAKFPKDCSLFPPHQLVRQYLHDYAEELKPILSLQTQVLSITRSAESGWDVRVLDLKTKQERTTRFDAVLVASGHYNDPFIPNIKGLAEFDKANPGSISHSKFYRRPDQYAGKKVIIVGNSASGIDLSAQIATVCQLPIIVSEKVKPNAVAPAEDRAWAKMVPEIKEFVPSTRSVVYADGTTDDEVDTVIFCTGYFYSFPFLKLGNDASASATTTAPSSSTSTAGSDDEASSPSPSSSSSSSLPPIITDGSHAAHLYQHILYTHDPTLAFLGIPQRIVPFPVSEAQAGWVARIWSGRLPTPSFQAMTAWEADLIARKIGPANANTKTTSSRAALHNMAFPQDVEYINALHAESLSARPEPELLGPENNGQGKIPPYWGADKAWTRERFPLIKLASRALGDRRHAVRSLEELGFDYTKWKMEKDLEEKAEAQLI
ncbi:thiol-specific monooxygenase [Microdochium trichocladiopsis]|uniref:Thiol-specific monooxygenase n=1 Tax=Microdochium trichocladiopsis TaxID=1682393 RepID=A0A9P8XW71_9PEZI|nr:thiol-specific monooxygenase [Microdochium trichocladiopsis]KAH7021305.1 thiol-specific monooxygenase [Microdochium trichocladiopsis]